MAVDDMQALFDQFLKFVRHNKVKKSLLILSNFNENVSYVDIYDFIILTTCEIFGISQESLFDDKFHYKSTDPRRTAYYLIVTELEYSHEKVAMQFKKSRSSVSMAILEFKDMRKNAASHVQYLEKHDIVKEKLDDYRRMRDYKLNSKTKLKK